MGKKVILAGGSGFLGQSLARVLSADGWEVVVLSRNPRDAAPFREVLWNAETGGAWAAELDGAAAVVNLAGRSINCVHSLAHSREILESRINAVKALGKGYARTKHPPPVWVQCSATGIYGNAGDRFCEEGLAPGPGFLAEVCRLTEAAFHELELPAVRRVVLRLGVVLDREAGIFPQLARMARRYLGGAAGSGRQFISWVHREDVVRIFAAALGQPEISGIYNACAPGPVSNAEFMRALRGSLHRPWAPAAPEFVVRLIAQHLLETEANLILHGQRCRPQRLLDQGFQFNYPLLALALADLTKKIAPPLPPPPPVSPAVAVNPVEPAPKPESTMAPPPAPSPAPAPAETVAPPSLLPPPEPPAQSSPPAPAVASEGPAPGSPESLPPPRPVI